MVHSVNKIHQSSRLHSITRVCNQIAQARAELIRTIVLIQQEVQDEQSVLLHLKSNLANSSLPTTLARGRKFTSTKTHVH